MPNSEGPPELPKGSLESRLERKSNVIEFPRKLERVTQQLAQTNPESLSSRAKEKLKDLASRFSELTLAAGGLGAWGKVGYETLQHLSPGHTIYDNPEMFATFMAGAIAINGAGLLAYLRSKREWTRQEEARE